MFCSKCGKEIKDEAAFCPYCGAKTEESADEKEAGERENKTGENTGDEDFTAKIAKLNDTKDTTSEFDKEDIDNNKGMSILAYLSWLVLIPIFAAKKSRYAQFHANQGLILAIIDTAYWIINGVITGILMIVSPIASAIVCAITGLFGLVFLVLVILGIVNAASGKAKELPVIGKYKILK